MIKKDALNAVIATNRFGMGARPGEIATASSDPRGWLLEQLTPSQFTPGLPDLATMVKVFEQERRQKKNQKSAAKSDSKPKKKGRDSKVSVRKSAGQLIQDSLLSGIDSSQSFSWRLLDFFSNHFSVSAVNNRMWALAPLLERESIAPNLFGRFEDMLVAVSQHPTMLIYLNNERSFGPDSRLGKKQRGLNENLGREILELHTLGVNGGYTQTDVRELSMAITGWSVATPRRDNRVGFLFRQAGHQPGTRTLLGRQYRQSGVKQGEQMLRDLAQHPSTASHVSFKLAQHLVSDKPPSSLVEAMTDKWLATGGDLRQVVSVLVTHDDAWQPEAQKFKTPREFVISVCRACDFKKLPGRQLFNSLVNMGQRPFGAGSPAGYSPLNSGWDGADALLGRIDWTSRLANRVRSRPQDLADQALGASLTPLTRQVVSRAESREQAVALLLMSPEFQWR